MRAGSLHLKSFEDATHLQNQTNDWSGCTFKDMSFAAQHGSDLRENLCGGVPS